MWKETTPEVYAVIRAIHHKDLGVFGTYTDPDGRSYEWSSGHPEIMTEWGFRNAENPLIKIIQKKEHESDKEWQCEYFLYCG